MKIRYLAGLTALAAGLAATALSSPAHATTPTTVTAYTQVNDRPDGGHGAGTYWANDSFVRALSLTADATAADCPGMPATGDTCYKGTITDTGNFTTIPNRGAPNQNDPAAASDLTIGFPAVTGTLSGTYAFTVYASAAPSASTVPASEDDKGTTPLVTTGNWAYQAFPAGTAAGFNGGAYSWSYKTACEAWTDSSTNGDGNQTGDGNITGKVCPVVTTPAPATAPSGQGDVINKFLNGLDVNRQVPAVNNKIIVFPVTGSDPAVQFEIVNLPHGFAIEYAPHGVATGLCVSEAVGSEPSWSAKTGLLLRGCFTPWETFNIKDAGNGSFQLVNRATGDVIQPNGTRSQFTGVASSTAAGSYFGWNTPGVVPA